MFRRKFWGTVLLSIPTVVWAPMIQQWLGYEAWGGPTASRFMSAFFGTTRSCSAAPTYDRRCSLRSLARRRPILGDERAAARARHVGPDPLQHHGDAAAKADQQRNVDERNNGPLETARPRNFVACRHEIRTVKIEFRGLIRNSEHRPERSRKRPAQRCERPCRQDPPPDRATLAA